MDVCLLHTQVCWKCGRKATETCSGCSLAKYCSAYCQHKDWEHHIKVSKSFNVLGWRLNSLSHPQLDSITCPLIDTHSLYFSSSAQICGSIRLAETGHKLSTGKRSSVAVAQSSSRSSPPQPQTTQSQSSSQQQQNTGGTTTTAGSVTSNGSGSGGSASGVQAAAVK